jgi:hypothetical protein
MFPCLAITSDDISVPFHPVSSSNLGLPAAANLTQNHPCILVSCESGGARLTSTPTRSEGVGITKALGGHKVRHRKTRPCPPEE